MDKDMDTEKRMAEAQTVQGPLDNAIVGEGTLVEPNVRVGFRYHPDCGGTIIGKNGILRYGTLVYGDVQIGDYFQSGHYVVIRAMVEMGDYCTVCNHSTLEGLIRMGNGVRIMSHVYVPSRTVIGNHVFIGPGVIFLNDKFPARRKVHATPVGAVIEDDVVIGGAAVILPGVKIGAGSFIAAGALVNKDIPARSLVMGVPGRIQALPDEMDFPNSLSLIQQPMDLWHPHGSDPHKADWPVHLGRAPLAHD
jgi:acetyltransferase-like isoleucine patch superfamily enzyme